MAPMRSSARALSRLLAGRSDGVERRWSSAMLFRDEWLPQIRWVNGGTRIDSRVSPAFSGGRKGGNAYVGRLPCGAQSRCFLGVGDGEEGDVLSRSYEERLVMGYSQEQLYNVVAAVDLYEDFLPWCQQSRIIKHYSDESFDAELEIGFKFLVESYISHVELEKPNYIKTTALDTGLFDRLINIWEFKPGPIPGTCDLHFLVDFKFQSPLYRQVASMFFKDVVSRLVGSFSDRCRRIYGPGIQVLENAYGDAGKSSTARR